MQRARINPLASAAQIVAHRPGAKTKTSRFHRGWSLFRDKRIPFHVKILALTLGATVTFLLIGLEVPLEGILAVAMPLLGVPFDFAFDGMEFFVLPILLAILILPSVAGARGRNYIEEARTS